MSTPSKYINSKSSLLNDESLILRKPWGNQPLWPDAYGMPFPKEFSYAKTTEAPIVDKKDTSFEEEKIADNYSNEPVEDTGPKCPYKNTQLIYVADSENPAIGGGNLLTFDLEQAKELQEEMRYLKSLMDVFTNDADIGREKIAALLAGLDPETPKNPEKVKAYHDVKGSELITEIWNVKAKETGFVRAKKLLKHKSKHKVDIKKIKQDASLYETKTLRYKNKKGKTKKVKTKILSKQKIKDMLGPQIKEVINTKVIDANAASWINESFGEMIDSINESLKGTPAPADPIPDEEINWETDKGAQLMRFYAYGSGEAAFDPLELQINAKADGKVQLALAEGKASANYNIPNKKGFRAKLDIDGTILDFGYFRANITFEASGMLGASLIGAAQIGMQYDPATKRIGVSSLTISDDRKKKKKKSKPRKDIVAPGAQLSVKAFAGLEVGGTAKGAGEWRNPEQGNEYKELLHIGVGVNAGIGAGLNADFYIAYVEGKLRFKAKASAVWGFGGGGEVFGEIGFGGIFEFIQFVYHQLNNNNFSYLKFIDGEAFKLHIGITLMVIETSVDAYEWGGEKLEEAFDYYKGREKKQQDGEKLAKLILKNPVILRFTSPEAKGALLYTLSHTSWTSWEEKQEEAIMEVLSWCQTTEEFNKTLRRIDPQGKKTSNDDKIAKDHGIDKLTDILDWSDERKFNNAVNNTEAFINKNAERFIIDSFDGTFHKEPYRMKPIQKRNRLIG